jgi:hypothetical protein
VQRAGHDAFARAFQHLCNSVAVPHQCAAYAFMAEACSL